MPVLHEVSCITTTRQAETSERVTHLGGKSPRGRLWRVTVAEAIEGILSGEWAFYFLRNGERIGLVVGMSRLGAKFLRAESDGPDQFSLLELPECKL